MYSCGKNEITKNENLWYTDAGNPSCPYDNSCTGNKQ